jgi:hypothetical protein
VRSEAEAVFHDRLHDFEDEVLHFIFLGERSPRTAEPYPSAVRGCSPDQGEII